MIFKNNDIVITTNEVKKKLLMENRDLINIKYMTFNDLNKGLNFSYDKKAIVYLKNKYGYETETIKTYIDSLYYIDEDYYSDSKLNFLANIKKELQDNDLLIYDKLFNNFLKNKRVIIYGYDYITKYQKKLINKLNDICETEINYEEYHITKSNIISFNFIYDEIDYIARSIIDLLRKNIDVKNIKLINVNETYLYMIKRIFKMYNLNINTKKHNILSTNIGKFFKDNYNSDIKITLDLINNKYDLNNKNNYNIYKKIVNIINDYYFIIDYNSVKDLILNDLKNSDLQSEVSSNSIDIVDLKNNIFSDNNYYFLLFFNEKIIPNIYKDEDYLSDETKLELGLEDSKELNKIEKEILVNIINNINNLTITYHKQDLKEVFYPSVIINEIETTNIIDNKNNNYSNLVNKLDCSKYLDDLIKFDIKDNRLDSYYTKYQIPYNTYNNKYVKIDYDDLKKLINNKLSLSYTSLNSFYECSYKYYLEYILKINKYETTFVQFIGNLFHHIMENIGSLSYDDLFSNALNSCLKSYSLDSKEEYYTNHLKEIFRPRYEKYLEMENDILLDKRIVEKNINISIKKDIDIVIKGFIDKTYFNDLYYAFVDYKTGNVTLDISKLKYGLNMQLSMYLYLLRKDESFKNKKVCGMYYQEIFKDNEYRFKGYSNINNIDNFDSNSSDSNLIIGLRKTSTGEYNKLAKIIDDEMVKDINNQMDNNINNAIENILDCNFIINPKKINDKDVSCTFCKYKHICNRNSKDYVELESGDNNEVY